MREIQNVINKYLNESEEYILSDVSDLLEDIDTLKLKISKGIINNKRIINKKDKEHILNNIKTITNSLEEIYDILEKIEK